MLFPKNLSNSEDCTSQARRPISGSNFGHTHYNTFPCTVCDLFFPTFVTGFSQKIPEKTVEFCEPIFRSNVRFQSPILDDRIISHPDSLCLSFFVPLLFRVCSIFVPIFLSKSEYSDEISQIFWLPTGTCGCFLQSRQTHSADFVPAEAGRGCDQPRNQGTPTQ